MNGTDLIPIANQLNRIATAMEHIAEEMKRSNDLKQQSQEISDNSTTYLLNKLKGVNAEESP